jgi:hypothetical protein
MEVILNPSNESHPEPVEGTCFDRLNMTQAQHKVILSLSNGSHPEPVEGACFDKLNMTQAQHDTSST